MIRDVKLERLDFVICDIFWVTPTGRTRLDKGPMSVGLVSFVGAFLAMTCVGAFEIIFGCMAVVIGGAIEVDEPGNGIRVVKPLVGIRDCVSCKEREKNNYY